MNKLIVLLLGAALFFVNDSQAESVLPISGLTFEISSLDHTEPELEFQASSIAGSLYYSFADSYRVQLKYGFNLSMDSSPKYQIPNIEFGVDSLISTYIQKRFLNEKSLTPYISLGYAKVNLIGEGGVSAFGQSEQDTSYGAGLDYELSNTTGLYFEYVSLINQDDIDLSSVNVGLQYQLQ